MEGEGGGSEGGFVENVIVEELRRVMYEQRKREKAYESVIVYLIVVR